MTIDTPSAPNNATLPFARTGRCCSDLKLDRLILGELDADERASLHAHLSSSPPCLERHAALLRDREAFRAHPPPLDLDGMTRSTGAATVTMVEAPTAAPAAAAARRPRWSVAAAAPLFAVAVAGAVVIIAPFGVASHDGDELDAVRAKGGAPALTVFVRDPSQSSGVRVLGAAIGGDEPLAGDPVVHPGDGLRFAVRVSVAPAWAGVVGVDGAGVAALYAPITRVDVLGAHQLPGAVELDTVLGQERYIAFLCRAAPTAQALVVASAAERPQLAGCAVDVVTARKVAR